MTDVIMIALSLQLRVRNSTGPTTTNSRSTSPAGKNAAFSVAKPISKTNLPQLASFNYDSTYIVCLISYNCSSCWDYIGNLNQYESSENIDKVIAFAVGDDRKDDLIKYFNPTYEIKKCNYEDLTKLTKVSPTLFYIKNDSIKYVIMGAIPSLYNLEQNYFNN